jgi:hypothetical protein
MTKQATSEEIKDWFLKMQKDNRINMSDELKVLQSIIDRFGFKTIQEYADVKGLSYPGVLYQIEHNKIIPEKIGSVTFVC